ncbi:hypothetical protein EON63_14970 [archaeon]|nr:MAG: hypothetical protein EON63_14970 [archaeon]
MYTYTSANAYCYHELILITYPYLFQYTGLLQFDMWGVTPSFSKWDWGALRQKVVQHGVRNSLLLAPMPTASTAQVKGLVNVVGASIL